MSSRWRRPCTEVRQAAGIHLYRARNVAENLDFPLRSDNRDGYWIPLEVLLKRWGRTRTLPADDIVVDEDNTVVTTSLPICWRRIMPSASGIDEIKSRVLVLANEQTHASRR